MKVNLISLLVIFSLVTPFWATGSEENTMEKHQALNQRQQSIIPIAAFTADGDIGRLKPALNQGLDAGLAVNEIKEVLLHLYAYAGFPRSLNALSAFMEVMDERKAKGIEDAVGKEAGPVPPDLDRDAYGAKVRAKLAGQEKDISGAKWQIFSPAMDTFLKEHLFADLFVRDVISYQDRELATISALANMTGTEGQLYFHLKAAMNTGLTEAQMNNFISVLNAKVDPKKAGSAEAVLNKVLKNRTITEKKASNESEEITVMRISVQANGNATVFELNDSPAAKELYAQLPLSIAVENYSNNEKIFYPPKKLNTTNTPLADARAGTLAYYAPWGDVVMFYGKFGSAAGLYELGHAISGSEHIKGMTGTIQIDKAIVS